MAQSRKLPVLTALVLAAGLALTACGGGGGNSSTNPATGNPSTAPVYTPVPGPLDAVQEPLSEQVFANLAAVFAGTPMEGAVQCLNQVAVAQVPDILDAILVQLSAQTLGDPQALFAQAEPDIEMIAARLQWQLMALQSSLTGAACTGSADGANPLSGTPLAPLGDALAPVLSAASGSDLASLAAYFSDLSTAFDSGLAAIGAGDQAIVQLPILNGLLLTVQVALSDLDAFLAAASANDTTAAHAALVLSLDHLLNNLLTQLLPIVDIETLSAQQGLVSDLIAAEVSNLTALFGSDFSSVLDPGFDAGLAAAADSLITPIQNALLPGLLDAFADALAAAPGALATTGTPLDAVVDPLVVVNDLLIAGGSLTGTALDLLLATITEALVSGGSCPAAGTYLEVLCTLVQGLLDALVLDPLADPLLILDDLVNTLLGGI